MKLVKLSLAAVVAAGSFSFANAVALDEAIQNVDLSGYLRYRYDTEIVKDNNGNVDHDKAQVHKYKAKLNFASDIADNFKANVGILYGETSEKSYNGGQADVEKGFAVQEAYLSYTNYDTTFQFGRLLVGSIWTDDLYANGLKVLNNSVEGLTLAAYAFDNYNADKNLYALYESYPEIALRDFITEDYAKVNNTTVDALTEVQKAEVSKKVNSLLGRNLYGVAAIGSFAPVDFQLWVAYMNKIGTFYALDVAANLGDKDDFAYRIHAQYAGNALNKDIKNLVAPVSFGQIANGNFYGVEAGFNAFGTDFNLGYVGYGKKDNFTINSVEDKGQLINAGEIVMSDYQFGYGKKDFVFATIGYTYADVRFGVDLIYGTDKYIRDNVSGKGKFFEVTPRLLYKYSDKLQFSSFYAYGKRKFTIDGELGNIKETEKQIRLEAEYTF